MRNAVLWFLLALDVVACGVAVGVVVDLLRLERKWRREDQAMVAQK